MLNRKLLSGLAALALSAGAAAFVPAQELSESVFIEGGQYTAVLDQSEHSWRLLPGDGIDLAVSASAANCESSATLPEGIWLVTQDADGNPVLTAPSITPLPSGHPEQVALRVCGEAADGQPFVAAPKGLVDWLTYSTGAIYVQN
jgi:hypothetical protein